MRNPLLSMKSLAFAVMPLLAAVGLSTSVTPAGAQAYKVTNIVSDGSVPAITTDANFLNPWGISASGTWWISAANSGYNYVVPAAGTISFKVIVPSAANVSTTVGSPAGSVTTGGATGMILPNGTKASFLFSTLDGTISGWNSKLGTANAVSQIAINNSASGASYPGLALLNTSTNSYLLVPNFASAAIEVYDNTFKTAKLAGSFTDPSLPAGYAPFSVHILGTQVIVAYALRTSKAPYISVQGAGNGVVSVFDTSGNFVARAVTGGNLNSPWGVAYAPASFGVFSGDLLIGNFGDGKINAYDPKTYAYQGQLTDGTGKPLVYASLWDLLTGGTAVTGTTAVSGGDTSTVYFTAGLANEQHGLFAGIANTTVAGSTPAFGFSTSAGAATITAGSSTQVAISVAPTNGFSGTVTLACSGLPVSASCFFQPTQLTVSPGAPTLGSVIIETQKAISSTAPRHRSGTYVAGFSLALMLPFGALLAFRRRRGGLSSQMLRLTAIALFAVAASGLFAGCSDSVASSPATPAGQSNVVITATAGSVSQQTTFALTVQ
jgi:uncharacterized protein (TIGR03118 family)